MVRHFLLTGDGVLRAGPLAQTAGLAFLFVDIKCAEVFAYACLAPFLIYMGFIFLSEVFDCRQYRVRRGLAQTAERSGDDITRKVLQELDIPFGATSLCDVFQDVIHDGSADPAWRALSAGFFDREFEEELSDADHAVEVVHNDHPTGPDNRTGLHDVLESDRCVK